MLKFLIDTGSSKNYIRPQLVAKPTPNVDKFVAKSIGGDIQITEHTIVNLFNMKDIPIKLYLLPTLKTFDGILGNDTLKNLSAVIYTEENYMKIRNKIKIRLKQLTTQTVNLVNIKKDHMNSAQINNIDFLIKKIPKIVFGTR